MLESIFDVFSAIGTWIVGQFPSLMQIFYTDAGDFTFLGILAVCGLGFSVVFLLIGIIQRFLHFRG